MSMHHHHGHHHQPTYNRAFVIGIILNIGFVIVEAVFGFLTNSLALTADAGHNLSDVLGLILAWGASWLVRRRPTKRYTYGLRRSSILAALLNACLLLVAMGAIALEAIERLGSPKPIVGGTIITVALVGIVINGITAGMFISGKEQDLNIKAAFLHMVADALVSFGVVLAGIAIITTNWLWFDPVISLIIVVVILVGTWKLLTQSLDLVLDAVPQGIDLAAVRTYLAELSGVVAVHDLHIWAMSTTESALTAHLVMLTGNPGDAFLCRVAMDLHDKFGIEHTTIQIETGNFLLPCVQKNCCD
ncbi:cation diffusion facilitator family transporter [Fischerella sp. NIES-3754]|uniref:cation diffusion facilitator family transporter n=1 Tax=Fischerella sp. NIES-3754 TaxID=1752063 RepID=UPI0007221202|nr:cation diffusion facilitator family transporter [Fischerella sp. NIES-3754]BAU08084.1 cation diffusion facilitator family transporter [Fischerella sp. NIES-3754]BCX10443.1 MAG: cobalt transporter [Fischerella sp.]